MENIDSIQKYATHKQHTNKSFKHRDSTQNMYARTLWKHRQQKCTIHGGEIKRTNITKLCISVFVFNIHARQPGIS